MSYVEDTDHVPFQQRCRNGSEACISHAWLRRFLTRSPVQRLQVGRSESQSADEPWSPSWGGAPGSPNHQGAWRAPRVPFQRPHFSRCFSLWGRKAPHLSEVHLRPGPELGSSMARPGPCALGPRLWACWLLGCSEFGEWGWGRGDLDCSPCVPNMHQRQERPWSLMRAKQRHW